MVSLGLIIHSHQPVGNFDHVIEEAYHKAYAPFVQLLGAHPQIRVSLHYSGSLLEWIEHRHPEFFEQLRRLVSRCQVELVGGGYYEPILPAVPDADKVAQVRRLAGYLSDRFGVTPCGAWVAERVWEPALARPLAEAGVEYTILDDTHFLAAGLEPSELHGAYLTEEAGARLHLIPSLQTLRYTIPFREPQETVRLLQEGTARPGALFAVGDDGEKFGTWPGTYEHCYANGWLEEFFQALEGAQGWLTTVTMSDFLAEHAPIGRIYLPTASYAEMMEWALPAAASAEFKACREEAERLPSRERFLRFLRGGLWRNFLCKYPEANQLHKLMLRVSRRWQDASRGREVSPAPSSVPPESAGSESASLLSQAQTHLLASQCNDAYWHGIFGGLYAPHLRSALLGHLIQAESLLDQIESRCEKPTVEIASADFDADGQKEVLLDHPRLGAVLRPGDGGTFSSLRFKRANVELINSLMRRPEAYHDLVRQRAISKDPQGAAPTSIHDRVPSKESNLDALLQYDRYARHAFRTYVFPSEKQWKDFEGLLLAENQELAGGPWKLMSQDDPSTFKLYRGMVLRSDGEDLQLNALKVITVKTQEAVCEISCQSTLSADRTNLTPLAHGIEMVFNLLAPDAPDRYFLANEIRRPLGLKGEIAAPVLALVDRWQRVKITLRANPEPCWWIVPIETISQSEAGFERVYQGSAIMPVWRIDSGWRDASCTLHVEIAHLGE